ncbi:MAG: LA_2272 family surface repeat-containing protein [Myxococcota bacterium]
MTSTDELPRGEDLDEPAVPVPALPEPAQPTGREVAPPPPQLPRVESVNPEPPGSEATPPQPAGPDMPQSEAPPPEAPAIGSGTVGPPRPPPVRGLRAHPVINYVHPSVDVDGVQLAGVANVVRGGAEGAQISGLANWATGDSQGLQLASLANYGSSGERLVQIASVNVMGRAAGLQLGMVNVAGDLEGWQLGLVNLSRGVDYPIGLVNLVAGEPLLLTGSFSTNSFMSLGLRHGGRRLRYSFLVGWQPASPFPYAAGMGFTLGRRDGFLRLGMEGLSWQLLSFAPAGIASLQELRFFARLGIGRRFALRIGPSIKVLASGSSLEGYPFPEGRTISLKSTSGANLWIWPELFVGLSI